MRLGNASKKRRTQFPETDQRRFPPLSASVGSKSACVTHISSVGTEVSSFFAELQDSMGEHKLLQRALCGEIKTVKQELQDMQLVVVEDEAMAAKLRM